MTDWEMIIIDDKSPLSLGEVKWKYQDEKRIRWFNNAENYRPSATRNSAVSLAESEAILPLDADDMLGDSDVLSSLYAVWLEDTTRIIYGNLTQLLPNSQGIFQRGKTFQLTEYTFERAMLLDGIMPVTALHSKECHFRAGGWKTEFNDGLEDVEYWLAAGKAGFCGHKVNHMVLLYRRQEESRAYKMKHVNRRDREMKQLIEQMHSDVFSGDFPMGCCGGNRSNSVQPSMPSSSSSSLQQAKITKMDNYPENDLIWVEYRGPRKAAFTILGRNTRETYQVLGTGHKRQVHRDDVTIFKQMGRGQDFLVGIPNPSEEQELLEPEVTLETSKPFVAREPELATIERLDGIAAQSRNLDITPAITAVKALVSQISLKNNPTLNDMALGALYDMFQLEGWTVEQFANSEISDLTGYKGIGNKRAQDIIDKARRLLAVKIQP
jgi:hypothetical protein